MIIDELRDLLKEKGLPVYYGMCTSTRLVEWNYYVIRKKSTYKTKTRREMQHSYEVCVVGEEIINESDIEELIIEIEEKTGLRLLEDVQYDYVFKESSNMVVEVAIMTFTLPKKGMMQ